MRLILGLKIRESIAFRFCGTDVVRNKKAEATMDSAAHREIPGDLLDGEKLFHDVVSQSAHFA